MNGPCALWCCSVWCAVLCCTVLVELRLNPCLCPRQCVYVKVTCIAGSKRQPDDRRGPRAELAELRAQKPETVNLGGAARWSRVRLPKQAAGRVALFGHTHESVRRGQTTHRDQRLQWQITYRSSLKTSAYTAATGRVQPDTCPISIVGQSAILHDCQRANQKKSVL